MKRHNFKGQGAAHGNHKHHRAPGLDRRLRDAGPGLQGHEDGRPPRREQVTTLNLEVVEADAEREIVLVKGAVPVPAAASS